MKHLIPRIIARAEFWMDRVDDAFIRGDKDEERRAAARRDQLFTLAEQIESGAPPKETMQ